MPEGGPHPVAQDILERFAARTRGSRECDTRAKGYMPGGDTRTGTYYMPYPAYMESGKGCLVHDYDGNTYIDFLNNYTSLIHGHAHPAIARAVRNQLTRGTALGSAARIQTEHARHLRGRMPGLESVRYCNSGTEATLFAIRAARAFTGKSILVKMEGGYHGSHDCAEVSVFVEVLSVGAPVPRLEGRGILPSVLSDMRVVPFNDAAALGGVLSSNRGQVAAVILEPQLGSGGQIPPAAGYLQEVRRLADRHGALLIFDEVQTFRLTLGGMQELEHVRPDLTALAKTIGGGFPVGAFGGRRDIMAMFDPTAPHGLFHSGTFNGNNITMAAGLACMEAYDQAAVDYVNRLGQRLRDGFNGAFRRTGIRGQATGRGSLLQIHWGDREIRNARDAAILVRDAKELPDLLHLEMMNRGVFGASRGQYAISTPMTDRHVDRAVAALEKSLRVLKPYVQDMVPGLML